MTAFTFIQIIFLVMLSFIPVWAGGQAMKCYDEGHIFKSVMCVWIAMLINISFVLFGMAWVRYDWSFVTILMRLSH